MLLPLATSQTVRIWHIQVDQIAYPHFQDKLRNFASCVLYGKSAVVDQKNAACILHYLNVASLSCIKVIRGFDLWIATFAQQKMQHAVLSWFVSDVIRAVQRQLSHSQGRIHCWKGRIWVKSQVRRYPQYYQIYSIPIPRQFINNDTPIFFIYIMQCVNVSFSDHVVYETTLREVVIPQVVSLAPYCYEP